MARRLGLPIRTWYNYEAGVTIPAEVLLRFVELTSVEPLWLLHGKGAKFRTSAPFSSGDPVATVESLLRTALMHLERKNGADDDGAIAVRAECGHHELNGGNDFATGVASTATHRELFTAQQENRCIRVEGDAMSPIVADGAHVAYAPSEEPAGSLEGKLVVAWIEGMPIVRWFRQSGRYGLLKAENPEHQPSILLLDLNAPSAERKVRRVLWISTPH